MDELVYRFLLQSGHPRASVVADLTLLPLAGSPDGEPPRAPSFAVVDPVTGDRLALVDALGPVDGDALRRAASDLGRYAQRFGGQSVQGLLLRVDLDGATADEQMQAYRVWPTRELERVSLKAFPDLETLRTWRLLAERKRPSGGRAGTSPAADDPDGEFGGLAAGAYGPDGRDDRVGRRPGAAVWAPGALLAALAVADWLLVRLVGEPLLDGTQALLLVGAAALLLAAAIARSRRG